MNYAENNRISHRQLYRQMVLAFTSPFLLCLFGKGRILGISGIVGTAAALVLLCFYVIFLIRLGACCADLKKTAGSFGAWLCGLFFLAYVLLTGAYLLFLLARIVPASLVAGVSGRWISFWAVLVCGAGTHKGMQKRGRMAQVSGGLLLGGILIMMVLCLGQAKTDYLMEMAEGSALTGRGFLRSGYAVLCAFSGVGLLPFTLEYVEKQGSSRRWAALGILTVGGILLGMQLLLPAVFGWDRLQAEEFPILPLMAGADLPGNVLARFDVVWMSFLLYGLLFAIGSLFHYGNQILEKTGFGLLNGWLRTILLGAAVYALSFWKFGSLDIGDYYGTYLAYIYVPGLLLVQVYLFLAARGRWKHKAVGGAAAGILLCLFLSGCGGVEPEKRLYPLALGMDSEKGRFSLTYGMPDLPEATGQEKTTEEGGGSALTIAGEDFGAIEAEYNRTQEKYLDMGHLQILVLGKNLLEGDRWRTAMAYLRQEPYVGENVYVFATEDVPAVLSWKSREGSSLGEYLRGLLENREGPNEETGVTLRELYHQAYRSGELPALPWVRLVNEEIEVRHPHEGADGQQTGER